MSETRRLKIWRIRLLMFLAVIGPGFITANVDNDAGGIYTYSAAGAQFGYTLLWVMIPMTIALVVVQEMSARMGAVTGKGLSDLIREEYGFRITFFMMLGLMITNFGNVVAEFAGIASSLELFHISRYISVPVCGVMVWLHGGEGQLQERGKGFSGGVVFLLRVHHCGRAGGAELERSVRRDFKPPHADGVPRAGVSSTWSSAWSVRRSLRGCSFTCSRRLWRRELPAREYRASRWDVILGCLFTDIVAWFIVVACAATLYAHGSARFAMRRTRRRRCVRWPDEYAYILFAAGLFNASMFAASILPLSTAYTVCEGLGFESGVGKKFGEAKVFYWLYTLLLIAGGAVILMPESPLVKISILSQVVNGIVLPFVLIFMLLLVNKSELMGEQ